MIEINLLAFSKYIYILNITYFYFITFYISSRPSSNISRDKVLRLCNNQNLQEKL